MHKKKILPKEVLNLTERKRDGWLFLPIIYTETCRLIYPWDGTLSALIDQRSVGKAPSADRLWHVHITPGKC